MKIKAAGKTDKGRTRKNNEDAFLVDDGTGLYAVADGIGGHEGGEVASRMAIDTLQEVMKEHGGGKGKTPASGFAPASDPAVSALMFAFTLANTQLNQAGARDPRLFGMGTTMTALLLRGKSAHLAHVGDSRAYLLRNRTLEQVTDDHSVVAEQIRAGLIGPDQARRSPYRHVITRALGIDTQLLVDDRTIEIRPDDIFLLCTDGLTEMVGDQEIMRLLTSAAPETAAGRLIQSANEHGGVDNITVVVIKIEDL